MKRKPKKVYLLYAFTALKTYGFSLFQIDPIKHIAELMKHPMDSGDFVFHTLPTYDIVPSNSDMDEEIIKEARRLKRKGCRIITRVLKYKEEFND
jgi:hypothetical protein